MRKRNFSSQERQSVAAHVCANTNERNARTLHNNTTSAFKKLFGMLFSNPTNGVLASSNNEMPTD